MACVFEICSICYKGVFITLPPKYCNSQIKRGLLSCSLLPVLVLLQDRLLYRFFSFWQILFSQFCCISLTNFCIAFGVELANFPSHETNFARTFISVPCSLSHLMQSQITRWNVICTMNGLYASLMMA